MVVRNTPVTTNPGVGLFLNSRSALLRNRSRNSASMLQILIGRIDNCIHLFDGDVALDNLNNLIRWKSLLDKNGIHTLKIN